MPDFRMLSTSGILGYGYPEASLERGIAMGVEVIGADAGSTDPGPHYLGSGKPLNARASTKRDLRLMLRAAIRDGLSVVVSSAGGGGGEPQLQDLAEITREIAREDDLHFKLALIHSEQDAGWVKDRLASGRVRPMRNAPPIDNEVIDRAERIVGCMGPEPFMAALDAGAQVVIAGRSTDPAPWAGAAMRAQQQAGPSWYAGKMLECAAASAWPKGADCIHVSVSGDSVVCEPPNPERRCTLASVANFALHENASPERFQEPGGVLDAGNALFEAVSDRAVRISGMTWQPDDAYTVKLEGAELVGHRAITICGTRDPGLIGQLDHYLDIVRDRVAEKGNDLGIATDAYRLTFRAYGRDGVMGEREPLAASPAHEVGLLIEALADDEETATTVLSLARVNALHNDFPGRLCREGNMAFPFSPSDISCGPAYRFSVYHVVEPDDPLSMFPIEYESV